MKFFYLFLVLLINAIYALSGIVYKVRGVGSGSYLSIRSGPGTENNLVGKLYDNQLIFVTSTTNGWAKFYKGFVRKSYLSDVSGGSNYRTINDADFRIGPGTNYSKITTLRKDSSVIHYGIDPFTKNWAVTNRGYVNSSSLSSFDACSDCNRSPLKKAEAASDYARNHALTKSQNLSAEYIANALKSAGFSFTIQESACFYHTKGILKGMGFANISKPKNLRKGDIAVHGCNDAHPHGHIQIYNVGKWYSDFAQNSVNVYKSNSPPVYYYRPQY